MFKSKLVFYAMSTLMVNWITAGSALAANSCETRITELETQIAYLEAQLSGKAPTPSIKSLVACNSIDMGSVVVGTKCLTSEDAILERVSLKKFGAAWREQNGVIWSDIMGQYSQKEAAAICKKIGGILPELEDFNRLRVNRALEVFPNMKGRSFWTSSVDPDLSSYYATVFGDNGATSHYNQTDLFSVRCIRR